MATTTNRLAVFFPLLLLLLLSITTISGDDDDHQQQQLQPSQPYCASDGDSGGVVQCTITSPVEANQFNLSAALTAAFKNNCSEDGEVSGGSTGNCSTHFENLFLSSSSQLAGGLSLSAKDDFAGLTFASVSLYPAVHLNDFSCDAISGQLSKQFFVGASSFSAFSLTSFLASCTSLRQAEVALGGGDEDDHQIDLCSGTATTIRPSSPSLEYLVLRSDGYSIGKLQDYGFSCLLSGKLVALKLSGIAIKAIGKYAFAVRDQHLDLRNAEPENSLITINLDRCQLTEAVLKDVKLDQLGGRTRPVRLMLDNNLFETLPAALEGFLNSSTSNWVSLFGNVFNCRRQKSYRWLLSSRENLKSRVWGGRCTSGEALLDLQLYQPSCRWNEEGQLTCVDVSSAFDLSSEVNYLLDEEEELNLHEDLRRLLLLNCTSLASLPSNVLGTPFPRLQTVHIEDTPSLHQISPDAFPTASLTSLSIVGVHRVSLEQALSLVRRQPLLQVLTMSVAIGAGGLQSVPPNAFSSVNGQLTRIELLPSSPKRSSQLLSIGRRCIVGVSSSLSYLSFAGVAIAELQSGAFDLDLPSSTSNSIPHLTINLTACRLDETKLLGQPFNGALRPLKVALGWNSIRLLLQESFSFLLLEGFGHHQIDLQGNSLVCQENSNTTTEQESPHYWLYVNRRRLRRQISGARCEESKLDLFEHLETVFGSNGTDDNNDGGGENGGSSAGVSSLLHLTFAAFLALTATFAVVA